MKHIYKETDFAAARNNIGKNRNPDVVPADIHRVRLMTVVPDRNDYINAVFQHVCRKYSIKNIMVAKQVSFLLKNDFFLI